VRGALSELTLKVGQDLSWPTTKEQPWVTWQWLPVEEDRAKGAEASPGKD